MIKLGLGFVLFALASCATLPSAEQQGIRLMAQLKEASGGALLDAPRSFRETGAVVRGDVRSTYETWGDFWTLRSVSRTERGGQSFTRGFDGRVAWSAGPDGNVETDSSPAGLASARLSTYLTNAAYFYPDRFPAEFVYRGRRETEGVAFDVVSVTPEGGGSVDLWLDVRNHRLQRITGIDGGTSFAGVVERYEVFDGAWIPVAITQTIDGQTMAHTVTSYEFTAVPDARFAPPAGE